MNWSTLQSMVGWRKDGVSTGSAPGIRLSLPEIEALSVKAARGAGFNWGVAEESGVAVRWLAMRGLPGPKVFLRHLLAFDQSPWNRRAPVIEDRVWHPVEGAPLCPIAAGTALSDNALLPQGPKSDPLELRSLANPILILPFVWQAARACRMLLIVHWDDLEAVVEIPGVTFLSGSDSLETEQTSSCWITPDRRHPAILSIHSGRVIAKDLWEQLNELALRSTVPPSERSRSGAGAGDTDND